MSRPTVWTVANPDVTALPPDCGQPAPFAGAQPALLPSGQQAPSPGTHPAPPPGSQRDRPLADLDFVVVDVETTGWSPADARITEVAAVRLRSGRVVGEFATLVNPGMPVPASIEALTGITSRMTAAAPQPAAVLPALLGFTRGGVLAAHNAPFDLGFLTTACRDCGLAWPALTVLDTVEVARQLLSPDEVPDRRLQTLASYFATPTQPCHRALADALATASVLDAMIARLAGQGVQTLGQLHEWLAVALALRA